MRLRYLVKRIAGYLATIVLILLLNFILIRVMPGDPMCYILGEEDYYAFYYNSPDYLEQLRAEYGLDGSIGHQFGIYCRDIARLDFGTSYHSGRPVLDLILFRAGWTLKLVLPATILAALLGVLVGLPAGWRAGGKGERLATPLFTVLHTIPTYCLSIILLSVFSYRLGWLPLGGMVSGGKTGLDYMLDILWHMTLPLLVLTLYRLSYDYLIIRSSARDIRDEPYITTAFSKGLPQRKVLFRHVLPNALLPYITIVCMQFGAAVAGTMTLEVIYNWNGMGRLIYESVENRDFPILQTGFLVIAICVILANLLADALYVLVDPRLRKEGTIREDS